MVSDSLAFVAGETTDGTFVGALSRVCQLVPPHVSTLRKSPATNVTDIRPLSSVGAHMQLKVNLPTKAFVAVVALKRL
jgi:hypothetical protein